MDAPKYTLTLVGGFNGFEHMSQHENLGQIGVNINKNLKKNT